MTVYSTIMMLGCLFDWSSAYRVSNLFSRASPNFVRESELKHARVALVAVPTLGIMSTMGIDEPVTWLSTQPLDTQLAFFSTAALIESTSISRLGPNFSLKDGVVPGNYFNNNTTSIDVEGVELVSGRMAMLVAASILASGVA